MWTHNQAWHQNQALGVFWFWIPPRQRTFQWNQIKTICRWNVALSDVVFDQSALRQKRCVSDCFSLSDWHDLKVLTFCSVQSHPLDAIDVQLLIAAFLLSKRDLTFGHVI
jgi:hypothetical protein